MLVPGALAIFSHAMRRQSLTVRVDSFALLPVGREREVVPPMCVNTKDCSNTFKSSYFIF